MIQINTFKYLITILILFSSCSSQVNETATTKNKKEYPDQEGWNSTFRVTNNGEKKATIKYGYMKRFNKTKMSHFSEGVVVYFYNDLGERTSTLTADKGKLDEKTRNVEAIGNVVAVADKGNLTTEKLWWDNTIEKVITDQFVTFTTAENDTFYGVGFESDQNLDNWKINDFRGKTNKSIDLGMNKKDSTKNNTTEKDTTNKE